MLTKLSIVIVSNGAGTNFVRCLDKWTEFFNLGQDLYVCGPRNELAKNNALRVNSNAIIDFTNDSNFSFPINLKKKVALDSIDSEYIYFVHDRFYPTHTFKDEILALLDMHQPDFGAVDVYNLNGTLSLSELRLKRSILSKNIDTFLLSKGRSSCLKESLNASEKVALNGGQFFLRKKFYHILETPMNWGEMEDDIMSLELQEEKGIWFAQPNLITLVHKNFPEQPQRSVFLNVKVSAYSLLCSLLKMSLLFSKNQVLSVSDSIDKGDMSNENEYIIIDPLHKRFTADYYPSSLEKFSTALRYYTNGKRDFSVKKSILGWHIY